MSKISEKRSIVLFPFGGEAPFHKRFSVIFPALYLHAHVLERQSPQRFGRRPTFVCTSVVGAPDSGKVVPFDVTAVDASRSKLPSYHYLGYVSIDG
jgi:hypothetical protein